MPGADPSRSDDVRVATVIARITVLSLAMAAVLVLMASSASAAPQGAWQLPPDRISALGEDATDSQVAIGPDGTATAVWSRDDGSKRIIQAATRPPGGSFGAAVDLSATGQSADVPQIAVAPDGTTTVVWKRYNGTWDIVQAATRPPGGSFGAAVDLSATGQSADHPQIAVAPDGTFTAVWTRSNGSDYVVQAATRPPGGSFGAAIEVSPVGTYAFNSEVAIAPDGTATVIWTGNDAFGYVVQAATRPPGGSFEAADDLWSGGYSDYPQIASAPDGTVTAVWVGDDGSNFSVQAATRPPGGTFEAAIGLSTPGQLAELPQIAFAADGTATAVWYHFGSNVEVQAATRLPGDSFGTAVDLSAPGEDAYSPQIAIAPDGTTTAVWVRNDGSDYIIQTATRLPGDSFGSAVDLSAPGRDAFGPQVAVGADGAATTVWKRSDGTSDVIRAASTVQPSPGLAVSRGGSGSGDVTSSPAGIDCGGDCAENYPSFTKVTLTATPTGGSTFGGWDGACSGASANTCELTMLDEEIATANFTASPPPPPPPPPPPSAPPPPPPPIPPAPPVPPAPAPSPAPDGKAKLKISKVKPKHPKVKRGKKVKIEVTGKNTGDQAATNAKFCLKINQSVKKKLKLKGKHCKELGKLAPGQTKTRTLKVKAKGKAKKGKKYQVKFKLYAKEVSTAKKSVKVKVKKSKRRSR